MKRAPLYACRAFKITLGLVLLPPLFWSAALALIPTECARRTIAKRLEAASGRKVNLGKVRVGLGGGVELEHLAIGAPLSADDPWLKVAEASINVSLIQLLFGTIEPTEVTLYGLDLRVLRHSDGQLELSDFLAASPENSPAVSSPNPNGPGTPHSELNIRITGAQVQIMDQASGTRLALENVQGVARCRGPVVHISDLRGTLNGGAFQLAAQLDRSGIEPAFEGEIQAENVALGEGMSALQFLVPVLAGTPRKLTGSLALHVYLRGRGDSQSELRESIVGHGDVRLESVELGGSRFLAALSTLVENPSPEHVGTVNSTMAIKAGRVVTEKLSIDLGQATPAEFAGWTDFDGRLDYHPRLEGLPERIQSRGQEILSRLKIDVNEIASVRLRGTLDHLVVTVDGVPLNDRSILRTLGHRLREKALH